MILFFKETGKIFAVSSQVALNQQDLEKLVWLFRDAEMIGSDRLNGRFVGPRKEMITPWSTNAVEITQNMGIKGIDRIEEFFLSEVSIKIDPMLQAVYEGLDQTVFTINHLPEPVISIEDIPAYNQKE